MSAATARRSRTRGRELLAVAGALVAVLGILLVQPRIAQQGHKAKQTDDVFLLPPPNQLRALTFGYKGAAVDLLWAKLVLEYGIHWQEKRAFPDIRRYIDGVIALEPDHPALYAFVDTMLLFTPIVATDAEARTARTYLERGTRERPYDPELWLHYGQFLAFLAPSFLKDEAEIDQWRKDGALAIARAIEIGADPERSLAVSTILTKAGERKATIEHLQRAYVMTDDPETRRQILLKLQKLEAANAADRPMTVVEYEWNAHYPFLTRSALLLVGPKRSAAKCAGPASYERRGCPRDWSAAVGAGQ